MYVRIELPREYDPRDIDVSTVRLGKDIPAWPRPVETVDYDRDGVEELMLRFDFQAVLDYLLREGQAGDSVPISVTGAVDGRRFVGTDSIVLRGTVVKPIRNG